MSRLISQLMTIFWLLCLLYLIYPDGASGQTFTQRGGTDAITPAPADLPYWDDLIAARPCTPDRLAQALRDDHARGHCAAADQQCHHTAASVILRVCASSIQTASLAFCDDPNTGPADAMACRIRALSGTTLPVAELSPYSFFQHGKTEAERKAGHAATEARAAAIRAILPSAAQLRADTSQGLPARKRAQADLARIRDLHVLPCPPTIPAANIPLCEDAETAQYLDVLARSASGVFAVWEE